MTNVRSGLWDDHDTLKEVANVAAGHAATALSRLTDRNVFITVPDLLLAPLTDLPEGLRGLASNAVAVEMRVLGEVRGRILYLMSQHDACLLADVLLGRVSLDEAPGDELTESCLQETANVLGGAYTGALARMTGHDVMLSVPKLRFGYPLDLLAPESHSGIPERAFAFCVATSFRVEDLHPHITGRLLLVSERESLEALLRAVRVPGNGVLKA